MADTDIVTLAKINYWCREKHFRHMQNAAQEGLRKYGNDPVLKFFNAYSLILEGREQEAIRELDMLKDKRDVNLCSILALIYAHKLARSVDREAVTELDSRLKEERKQAGEKGLYFAGLFLFHSGRYDKAREYIDRMLKQSPSAREGLAIKGWLELLCGREQQAKKAVKYFDEALGIIDDSDLATVLRQDGPRDIDSLFGKAKFYELRRNFSGALELMNQAVVAFPNFVPALVEKMKIQMALQDWEQTVETAHRALNISSDCVQAERYLILHMLCREGNYQDAANKIGDLVQLMDRVEPKNAYLFDAFAKVFCRVCGRNQQVLQQTYYMAERAMSLSSNNAEYVTELGYELLLQGKTKEAIKCYRNAMKIDETSVSALTDLLDETEDSDIRLSLRRKIARATERQETLQLGIIRCQLLENQLEDAAQQLEFLNEIQQSIGKTAELSYLSAVLAMKRGQDPQKVMDLMQESVETHFAGLKGLPLGADYLLHMNPDFLLQVVRDYLCFAPQQPSGPGQPPHPVLKRCAQVLDPMARAVPGLMEALYLLGKVKFLSGNIDAAQSTLQHCIDQDQTYSDAHILMAQIHLHQNNFKLANQSLEVGLSYNFEVREHPVYHLIKARICKKQGDHEGAVKTLQMAMQLPGIRGRAGSKPRKIDITINDRVSVFLELAEAHRALDQQHEAAKVMQDAMNDFQGSAEEIRISIANADLSLARGDIEGSLAMLRNITPDQPYFVQAREKMAEIYLHHRKDKRLYASCYRELVDKHPSPHTCLLLGDAYMSIQEPERAIEVYEAALKKNPRDFGLASKIGQALVKTHNYGKAINYYEAALKTGGQSFLRHDLAELLIKLRQLDKAEKVLRIALEGEGGQEKDVEASTSALDDALLSSPMGSKKKETGTGTDLDTLMEHTKYYVLLSKVYDKQEKMEQSLLHLTKARDMQTRVLKRVQVEQPDAVPEQKQFTGNICSKMAQHAIQTRDYDRAIKFYKEALMHNDNDGKLMLELAKLYLTTEDLDACQHQCMTLLKNDKENDSATVMMADIMFRKNEYDQAMYHFQQLLERKPDHYDALVRLVDLMRRAGKLDEVPKFFELAENASSRTAMDAGFNYCKGLFEWYSGNPNQALKYFNMARKDADWGDRASYSMIEICLNPDSETIGGEVFESVEADLGSNAEKADSEQAAIRTAEKLLRDVRPRPGDIRYKILENMILVSTKQKFNVEKALGTFMEISTNEREFAFDPMDEVVCIREHVGALYGMATAYMVMKQNPRARNQLKRVAKATWNMEDAEDLEKSWLLLADIYIQSAKYDMAQELLKRCVQHNKACCKAYEYLGFIMEKEQSYKDAAMRYESSWKYGSKNNPNIGYKLAFNYLKAKRYVDAIDIAHHVLNTHPNYPKIRKEILDKARQSLRV